jgi:hypothetical protein
MNPIIKTWSFKGWAIDLIGQIYPPSSKGHKFVLVATDSEWIDNTYWLKKNQFAWQDIGYIDLTL